MKVVQEDVLEIGDADDRIIPKDQDSLLHLDVGGGSDTSKSKPAVGGVSEAAPWLLLSSAAALSPSRLLSLGVSLVVSAAPELPDTPLPPGVAFRRVPLQDSPSEDLTAHLDDVADAIEQERLSGGRTLVHCVAGVSRSAALVLAHLVKHTRTPLRAAFEHLRARRPGVRPNAGFFQQLIDFERSALGCTSVSMVHNAAAGGIIPDVYEPDYRHMLWFQQHYSGRNFGRH